MKKVLLFPMVSIMPCNLTSPTTKKSFRLLKHFLILVLICWYSSSFAQHISGELNNPIHSSFRTRTDCVEEYYMQLDSAVNYNVDGTPTKKVYYKYDEHGNKCIEVKCSWEANQWKEIKKYVSTYDENNYLIGDVCYEKSDGQWLQYEKWEYFYDAHGIKTGRAIYEWENGQWVGYDNYNETYDENGNRLLTFCYWEDGQWGSKNESYFDDYGNLTLSVSYVWKDDQWEVTRKDESTYDSQGNFTSSISYIKKDGQFVYDSKSEGTYDFLGNLKSSIRYLWENNQWVENFGHITEYTYDDHFNPLTETNSVLVNGLWSEGTFYQYENNYNNQGVLISRLKYWNYPELNICKLEEKDEYIYDNDGTLADTFVYYWRDDQWKPFRDIWSSYTYDNYGNETSRVDHKWENGQYVVSWMTENAYDSRNNRTSSVTWNFNSDNTMSGYKYEYEFDNNDNMLSEVRYNWDNQWVKDSYKTYYYQKVATDIENIAIVPERENHRIIMKEGKICIEKNGRSYGIGGELLNK